MKKSVRMITLVLAAAFMLASLSFALPVYAEDAPDEDAAAQEQSESATISKAYSAGIAIAVAALGGVISMGMAISKAVEGTARQPEAGDKIRTTLMLGLVFMETAIIYALLVVIMIIFVL